jgi:hypothetical protein
VVAEDAEELSTTLVPLRLRGARQESRKYAASIKRRSSTQAVGMSPSTTVI